VPKLNLIDSYDRHAFERLEAISVGLSTNFDRVRMLPEKDIDRALSCALLFACLSTHDRAITLGRELLAEVDPAWLIARIERIADTQIDFEDEWDYRRLLELYQSLDAGLLAKIVSRGLISGRPDLVEAAEDFSK